MNGVVEFIKALGPVITAATPVLLILVGWWTNNHTKKVMAAQTKELTDHSDSNREQVKGAIASSTGTFKQL
jgi:hypothetical protein